MLPPVLHEAMRALDPRIVAPAALATPGAALRLLRWTPDRPAPDLSRLSFVGSDDVRDVVVDTLAKLPAPVAWTAIEAVQWFEVGCGTKAWTCAAPAPRALPGDRGRLVMLCGRVPSLYLPGVVAHELAHIWVTRLTEDEPTHDRLPERVARARLVAALKALPPDEYAAQRAKWIDERVRKETSADELAAVWGVPHDDGADPDWMREVSEHIFASAEDLASTCVYRSAGGTP